MSSWHSGGALGESHTSPLLAVSAPIVAAWSYPTSTIPCPTHRWVDWLNTLLWSLGQRVEFLYEKRGRYGEFCLERS